MIMTPGPEPGGYVMSGTLNKYSYCLVSRNDRQKNDSLCTPDMTWKQGTVPSNLPSLETMYNYTTPYNLGTINHLKIHTAVA